MNIPTHHIFYETKNLSLNDKINIVEYAKENSTKWWIDKLDPIKTFARTESSMKYDEILALLDDDSHFTIIHRKPVFGDEYGEVGFVVREEKNKHVKQFLWIYIELKKFDKLIEKFGLEIDSRYL